MRKLDILEQAPPPLSPDEIGKSKIILISLVIFPLKGVVIFNGEYPPGVFSSEKPKILRPLIFSE